MNPLKEEFHDKEILDEFVRVANEAADAAGDVVRKFYGKPQLMKTFEKIDSHGQIVEQSTTANRAAEDAIKSVILRNFPHHSFTQCDWIQQADADYVWVVDPIDGTTSFKNGIPLFGTLIVLLCNSKPILGIMDHPILHMRWVGVQGRKTTLNGETEQTRPCQHLSRATLYASSPLHFSDEEQEHFFRLTDKVSEPIYGAECYTYGRLASGFIDLIVQSFLAPYDFLAFIPIIEGAGGIITDWAGKKLQWEASPNFEGPRGPPYYRILAAGDKQVHKDALDYLSRVKGLSIS